MLFATFIAYFVLFIVIFAFPGMKNRQKSNLRFKFFLIPALLGLGMVFLTAIKMFFVYKFLMLVFVLVTMLLSYWQWGDQIRHWWR